MTPTSDPARAFTVVHLTDTQVYSDQHPEVYRAMTTWIADNAAEEDIAYVMHTGDLVENWHDPDTEPDRAREEFARAAAAHDVLDDAGVPNGVLPGNHDNLWNHDRDPGGHGASHALFNESFGPLRYKVADWWGGTWRSGDNSSHYDLVQVGGVKLLFLSIGYNAPLEVFDWAEEVVATHHDHNVVVGTHYALGADANRAGLVGPRGVGFGELVWERLVERHENVALVLCGHCDGQATRITRGVGGNDRTVVEMLADYQNFVDARGEKAAGFLRLLRIDPIEGTLAVRTYSPVLDSFAVEDADYLPGRFAASDGTFEVDFSLPVLPVVAAPTV